MISIRRHYYGHEHDIFEDGDTTINTMSSGSMHKRTFRTSTMVFADAGVSTAVGDPEMAESTVPREGVEAYEMNDFSEKAGF